MTKPIALFGAPQSSLGYLIACKAHRVIVDALCKHYGVSRAEYIKHCPVTAPDGYEPPQGTMLLAIPHELWLMKQPNAAR